MSACIGQTQRSITRPAMLSEAERSEVIAAARRGALDYYLSALLAPSQSRDDLLVLAAFEGELRNVIATVGDPILAEIRLQWWRDAVAGMSDSHPQCSRRSGHPVADALAGLVAAGCVPADSLQRSIDARSTETGNEPIVTDEDLDNYLDRTDGEALARAVAAVSALSDLSPPEETLVRSAGRSVGLTRILMDLAGRRTLAQARGQARGLPGLSIKENAAPGAPRSGSRTASQNDHLADQYRNYADQARTYRDAVRHGWTTLSRGHRAALGPVALVGPYLRGLQRLGYLEPHPVGVIAPVSRVARLWWAVRFARL